MPRLAVVLILALLGMAACSVPPSSTHEESGRAGALGGTGEFTFRPEGGREIRVFYAGSGDLRRARVVVVLHGVNRNADDYRDTWLPLIEGRDVIVVAPEFTDRDFPEAGGYNLGGLGAGGVGAFDYIEPLFSEVVRRVDGEQTGYDMFGHSAGAQFVHRYVEFADAPRLRRAVAANAGWYTLPGDDATFPYGMEDAPVDARPETYLRRDLTVLLGADDIGDENLRTVAEADAQGKTRLERGMTFFLAARTEAARVDTDLAWRLEVVPGVGHDQKAMAAVAATRLFGS